MGVDLSQYNNSWYDTGASKFKVALWFIVKGIVFLNPLFPFVGFKVSMLRMFGAKVGKGVVIKPIGEFRAALERRDELRQREVTNLLVTIARAFLFEQRVRIRIVVKTHTFVGIVQVTVGRP